MTEHGYVSYTRGCPCTICKRGKADYMARRRKEARALAAAVFAATGTYYVADIAKHGTRYGFEEAACRCLECRFARAEAQHRWRLGAKSRKAS